jgi:hypothetical protein
MTTLKLSINLTADSIPAFSLYHLAVGVCVLDFQIIADIFEGRPFLSI